ncbi:MAG TPA: enoyl-CoA hydratase/isomerase family protein [Dehalococcoidia bacterium]|nr:enoyl-CoA hydratase/isomerase family protein [Dehalococcoidia bacterium]
MQTLRLELRGPIAYLTLARPERANLIDPLLLAELADACEAIEPDQGVRVVLLSAGDAPHFSRGWDWSSLSADEGLDWGSLSRAFEPLAQLPRPVVCAIAGECLSAGLELALACDVRICADDARFALPETGLGLIPLAGGTQRLARVVGRAWATYLVLTGQEIGAQEALDLGLVSRVVPRERLLEEAHALCQRIAQRGPLAVRYAKEAVHRGCEMPLEQALRYETDLTIILQTTQDRAEGVRAFLEKRPPRFTGT